VDLYSHYAGRSAEHHRNHPLAWDEMCFEASGDGAATDWLPLEENDKLKEGVEFRYTVVLSEIVGEFGDLLTQVVAGGGRGGPCGR
jgi:hypothetical protein